MYIPSVIYKREGNKETVIDLYSRLLQHGIIFITGTVDGNMSNLFFAQLAHLKNDLLLNEFTIYINSGGGSVYSGTAMVDMIRCSGMICKTVCIGLAASMASTLLAAGSHGHRYALKNSRIMIHQPLYSFHGEKNIQATDFGILNNEILRMKDKTAEEYANFSKGKKDKEFFLQAIERDNYLSPEDAIELGLIDEIYEEDKDR